MRRGRPRGPQAPRLPTLLCNWLIAHGADVLTVQRALGHAKATTTLNTYSHLWPTAEDRTRQGAESMLIEALAIENPADSVRTTGTD
jgi:integrase